jgi:hypothetical protein
MYQMQREEKEAEKAELDAAAAAEGRPQILTREVSWTSALDTQLKKAVKKCVFDFDAVALQLNINAADCRMRSSP